MADIKAADVAKLRAMTGAGMMDCKNALVEANGDYERAQEIIREKGKLVAAKRADRDTTEGIVTAIVSDDNTKGIVVALGTETDFVAKTDGFKGMSQHIANAALDVLPADNEALKGLKVQGSTVEEIMTQETGKTGEKHQISFYGKLEAPYIVSYIHMNSKLGTLVGFSKVIPVEAAKDIAMQVAAMNPVSVTKEECPQSVIDAELNIGREKARQEGKPENMIEKIAQGMLNKFFKESTLMEQAFIKEQKQSVADYLKSVDPEAKVVGFVRFSFTD